MKTKHSRLPQTIIAAITLLAMSLTTNTLYSQVTIGSDIAPTRAALLDLKMRQEATVTGSFTDDNITSTTGGILLPRVKLINPNTLEPFIATSDNDWTDAAKKKICKGDWWV
jgi:hypothetical protein